MPTNPFELIAGIAIGLLLAWVYVLVWKARYTAIIREDAVEQGRSLSRQPRGPRGVRRPF